MSLLAEKNVIGSLLMAPESMKTIYGMLEPDMFSNELLSSVYVEFLKGYTNGYPVNLVILDEKMQRSGIPKEIILQTLKDCIAETVSSLELKRYAENIIRSYRVRKFNQIIQTTQPVSDTIDIQIGQVIHQLEALLEQKAASAKTLSVIAKENKHRYFQNNEDSKLYLGFPRLDELLGGLEGGDMIVIGARPGTGKSAFVTQITRNLAARGKRIGFFNLEMQEKQMYERFVAVQSGIGLTRLRRASCFLGDEEERFKKANEVLEKQETIVISTGSRHMSEIRSESRHMGYDVIIIDYLQLVQPDKSYSGNRYAEVGAISRAVKNLAMEFNIPVIALSQLNRISEMRRNREPTMSELREAGDIEQDASIIMLLWNLFQKDPSKKAIKVEKQRQGKTGKVGLNFNGDLMLFEESKDSVSEMEKWIVGEDDDVPFV